jgi:2-phosphoglycerate kinase
MEERHRRGLKFRKREDHAIELFREAQAHLSDIARVNRILLELGRFYNPVIDAPIVDLATRRRIVELLESRQTDAAHRLLEERLALYARIEGEE